MSKAFITEVIQNSAEITGVAANRTAAHVIEAIVKEIKKNGKFTLPSFGTFTVHKTKARKGVNPRSGEPIKIKAGKTVRFKASPTVSDALRPYGLALTFASGCGCRLPAPWHKFVDACLRPSVNEAGQQIGEVGLRIDAVELTGFDQ